MGETGLNRERHEEIPNPFITEALKGGNAEKT